MKQSDWNFISIGAISVLLLAATAAYTSLQAAAILSVIDIAAIIIGIGAIYYLVQAGKHTHNDIIRPIMVFCISAPLFVLAFHLPTLLALVRRGTLKTVLPSGFWTGAILTAMMASVILVAYGFNVFHRIGQAR